jgi:GlpG protein
MRSIGKLPNEPQGRVFGDYLLAHGIRSEIEKEPDGTCTIWVLDDAHLDAARDFLDRFRQNPDAPEFPRHSAKAERLRSEEKQAESRWRRRVHNRRRIFPGSRSYSAGPLTFVLIVSCVIVFVFSQLGNKNEILRHFVISFPQAGEGGFLPEVFHGQIWRLFTPILVHFSAGHILFNMMWLFSLGSMVESVHGSGRFALLIAAFAVGSNLTEYLFGSPIFGGMSGVNYGLIGYVWIRGRCDPASGLHLDQQSVVLSIVWFFLCFTRWMGPIANFAHAGGLVLGMAWGWISARIALRKV